MSNTASGPVTFLFTDIEGSTRLWQQQPEVMPELLARHDALLRSTIEQNGGQVFKMMGDACYARFTSPEEAVHAAVDAQRLLQRELPYLRVRMALHSGKAVERDGDYFGPALNHLARLLAAGHGGQILLSGAVAEATRHRLPAQMSLRALGTHRLRDIDDTERIFQLQPLGLPGRFPPLNTLNVAARRAGLKVGSISALVLLVVASLAAVAVYQRNQVTAEKERIRRQLYVADMRGAQHAADEGNVGRALEILQAHRPAAGEGDLRGFEWRYLWRLCRERSLVTFGGFRGMVSAILSPDGRTLAAGGRDGRAQLWDVADPRKPRAIATLRGSTIGIAQNSIAFSPDGRILAVGNNDRTVSLWDAASHQRLGDLRGSSPSIGVEALAYSPDGKTLVAGSVDDAGHDVLNLWDVASHTLKQTLRGRLGESSYARVFSPDGKTLAVGYLDGTVTLWDVASWRAQAALPHPSYVMCLTFSPDGKTLAVGCGDFNAYIWDVASRRRMSALQGHNFAVVSAAFSTDGKTLATGGADQVVKLWDTASWREQATLAGHKGEVVSVAFSRDGSLLATGSKDGTARLWSVAPTREPSALQGFAASFSPDGKTLAVLRDETTIVLWNVARQETTGTLRAPGKQSSAEIQASLEFSPDRRMLASGNSESHRVRVWDIVRTRGAILGGASHFAAFSPDAKTLVTGGPHTKGEGGDGVLWNLATLQPIATFPKIVDAVAFSPDGKTLAAISEDRQAVVLWDVATQRQVYRTRRHGMGWMGAVAFSQDGKRLAFSASDDIQVIVLDLATKHETVLRGHVGWAHCVAFSPDGRTLATGGGDHTVKLWSIGTGQEVATLRGHGEMINTVAFSPDGNLLVSADAAGVVRLWRAATLREADAPPRAPLRP